MKFTSKSFGMNSREIGRRLHGEGYTFNYALWSWEKDGIVAFDGQRMTGAKALYNAWNETSTPKLKK